MYGLLLEGIYYYVKLKYGDEIWDQVLQLSGIPVTTFNTHKVYSESYIPAIAEAASEITGFDVDEIMEDIGVYFVSFVSQFGYDGVLNVLGRHLRDFLNGLDNLHEYLRFSYPKLKPPSFFCVNESKTGLTLHYRSRRRNFIHYVKGQIKEVARSFYKVDVDMDIVSEFENESMINVIIRLNFNNFAYRSLVQIQADQLNDSLPVPSDVFFEVFPFNIVFNRGLTIRSIGDGLKAVMPQVIGHNIDDIFELSRPLVSFTWESVMMHTNNVFEVYTKLEVKELQEYLRNCARFKREKCRKPHNAFAKFSILKPFRASESPTSSQYKRSSKSLCSSHSIGNGKGGDRRNSDTFVNGCNNEDNEMTSSSETEEGSLKCLKLKGQMMYMNDWDSIIFLGCPVMKDINDMFNAGLYINDLSMHDSSRDLILAGTQQSAELKLALDQEQQKSRKLEEFMKRLHVEMKRTDQLLYQMIPRSVADRLRKGVDPVETCETFECVTVLFSDVVGFTTICSKITPLQVVTMLNSMYTKFDQLSEKHRVYKVETIGDAYMVAAGAPVVTKFHACYICDMGLDMVSTMWEIMDLSSGSHITIRVGAHSGTVVAGVVGLKMPRYCLFGDAVNTASRMESNSESQKIHISETTKVLLEGFPYSVVERGTIQIKGKGVMKTFWLQGKTELDPSDPKIQSMLEEKQRLNDNVSDSQSNTSSYVIDGENLGSALFNPSEAMKQSVTDLEGVHSKLKAMAKLKLVLTRSVEGTVGDDCDDVTMDRSACQGHYCDDGGDSNECSTVSETGSDTVDVRLGTAAAAVAKSCGIIGSSEERACSYSSSIDTIPRDEYGSERAEEETIETPDSGATDIRSNAAATSVLNLSHHNDADTAAELGPDDGITATPSTHPTARSSR
ncbi:soluble guanylate cyclase gcy-31-like isoform X2 [Tubulanus polymorphus]|uniref:soluble guanylate cyclase gcy-31-like isoform X2 n=1 Tax=Tubulanus polymorphus TaxID=672921 RepID=UPI003DA562B5